MGLIVFCKTVWNDRFRSHVENKISDCLWKRGNRRERKMGPKWQNILRLRFDKSRFFEKVTISYFCHVNMSFFNVSCQIKWFIYVFHSININLTLSKKSFQWKAQTSNFRRKAIFKQDYCKYFREYKIHSLPSPKILKHWFLECPNYDLSLQTEKVSN